MTWIAVSASGSLAQTACMSACVTACLQHMITQDLYNTRPCFRHFWWRPLLMYDVGPLRCLLMHLPYICCPLSRPLCACFTLPPVCPQLGILVQHREACRSTLSFLTRLLDPGTALARLQEQQQQRQMLGGTALDTTAVSTALLQSQLERVGPDLSRMLMGAVVGALPYSRVADIAPVIQVGYGSRRQAMRFGLVCCGNKTRVVHKVLAQQWGRLADTCLHCLFTSGTSLSVVAACRHTRHVIEEPSKLCHTPCTTMLLMA
jgi:hypothetical protein